MFNDILGNEEVKQELQQIIKSNKLSHSYLFVGTEGIGKKLIAKEFSKMILCLSDEKYCNSCKSCIKFDSSNNPDFQIIEPDGNSLKIDQIRQMQRKVIEAPIISEKKVYIIDNADSMTTEAQNCLLKTLEEPPEFVHIILIGSNESNFLTTIKSRCTILKFKDIDDEKIKKYVRMKYGTDIPENMLQLAQGSIGKAEILKDKQELYNTIYEIAESIDKLDLIDFLKKSEEIYNYTNEKIEILDNMNVVFYNKSKEGFRFLNCISIIETAKKRLMSNGNFNMCIDNMLFNLWEEIH